MSEGRGDGAFGGIAVVPAAATCAEGGQTAAGGTSFPQVVGHRGEVRLAHWVAFRGGDVPSPPRPFDPADTVDHLGGARFAGKPPSGHHGSAGSGRVMLRNHRDDDIRIDPPNIPPATAAEKRTAFLDAPDRIARRPAGQFRQVRSATGSGRGQLPFFAEERPFRQYPRRSHGTPWAAQDSTGTPNAFPVPDHSGLPFAASVSRPTSACRGTPPG
ncbi:hypothetical protein ABT263_19270 [Kitasatospora sp. NPDC001603]|uniref:hypothetical protein n=1 Tax=Kitasatospora sp. NPDC001603 TaxID=3154388 RepID=UPI00332D40A3